MYLKYIVAIGVFCIAYLGADAVHAAVEQTKLNPGPYIGVNVSGRFSDSQQHAQKLAFIREHRNNPNITGFKVRFYWSELEPSRDNYQFDRIAEILAAVEGTNKQIGVFIDARAFGKNSCGGLREHPGYMESEGMLYVGGPSTNRVCMPRFWEEHIMDRYLLLLNAMGARFDSHPNLEMITEGETTISPGPGFTAQKYHAQMLRMVTQAKQAFPNTMIVVQINFYSGDTEGLVRHMIDVGGMGFGLPDTAPCRIPDSAERSRYARHNCNGWYRVSNYNLMRQYSGDLAISPNAETWDLRFDESDQVYLMAANYLNAHQLQLQSSFCSRVDGGCRGGYLSQVLSTLNRYGNIMNTQCPSSFGQCIANDGTITQVGEGGGNADVDRRSAGKQPFTSTDADETVYELGFHRCGMFNSIPYTPPTGLGTAYLPFLPLNRLIVEGYCSLDTSVKGGGIIIPGNNIPGVQYVWGLGYTASSEGGWEVFRYLGNEVEGARGWLNGEDIVQYFFEASEEELRSPRLFLVYICTWIEGEWKCGCRDEACAQSYWQLQGVQYTE